MLGYANVDVMLESITPEGFVEWQAYWELEPFGEQWWQTSTIASVVANKLTELTGVMTRKRLNDNHFFDDKSFIPKLKPAEKKPSIEEVLEAKYGRTR